MNNFNRAVKALEEADEFHGAMVDNEAYVRALEAAGLLAPDAEEEYQYGVRYIGLNHGGYHIEWVEPSGDAELDKNILQSIVTRGKKWGQFPEAVRRRISPPEVVNEAI